MSIAGAMLPVLPDSWQKVQMRRVMQIENGADYKSVEVAEGGYPVYGSGGVFRRAGEFLYDGESVLFGRKGTIDRPIHVNERFWTVDTMYYTRLRDNVAGRFLYYYATTIPYWYYTTSTALPSMTQTDLAGHVMPLPPLAEQRAIAEYLDAATAKIDTLIAKQTEMIRLLEERKRAVPAESLGRIQVLAQRNGAITLCPAHDDWQSAPLRTMFDRKKDIGHSEEPMVSVFRERGVIFKDDAENLNKTAENRDIYQLIHPGWLLVNRMKAWQGSVGISDIRGITSGHYICFSPRHDVDDRYLNALLRSPAYVAAYGMLSRGVRPGQVEIDNDFLGSLPILLGPEPEQVAIARAIDDETAKIESLIAKTHEHIALAKERRSALITAAVTGQIDVRAATRGVA